MTAESDLRYQSGLRFSISSTGEAPLLKTIAARKLSTRQAQNALEKGVFQLLHEHQDPLSVAAADKRCETPTFTELSTWKFGASPAVGRPRSSISIATAPEMQFEPRRLSTLSNGSTQASSSSSSSPSVHRAAQSLLELSEHEIEEALALSRQWKQQSSMSSRKTSFSRAPSISVPRRDAVPNGAVACGTWSEAWQDGDTFSPISRNSFDASDSDFHHSSWGHNARACDAEPMTIRSDRRLSSVQIAPDSYAGSYSDDQLHFVADELALMSEQAMSNTDHNALYPPYDNVFRRPSFSPPFHYPWRGPDSRRPSITEVMQSMTLHAREH